VTIEAILLTLTLSTYICPSPYVDRERDRVRVE